MLSRATEVVRQNLPETENLQLLCELQRDLGGFNSLVQLDREFVRQGVLLKHSKRGLQQRMFFLVGGGLADAYYCVCNLNSALNAILSFYFAVLRSAAVWQQVTGHTGI